MKERLGLKFIYVGMSSHEPSDGESNQLNIFENKYIFYEEINIFLITGTCFIRCLFFHTIT